MYTTMTDILFSRSRLYNLTTKRELKIFVNNFDMIMIMIILISCKFEKHFAVSISSVHFHIKAKFLNIDTLFDNSELLL